MDVALRSARIRRLAGQEIADTLSALLATTITKMSCSQPQPHVPTANTCQHCDKHLRVVHMTTPRCERCLPDEMTEMKTCACHLARYCDVHCQKEDWKTHKPGCQTAKENVQVSRMVGSEPRHVSFVKWCNHSREQFVFPALWALGAGTDHDRTESHFLVIYIDVEEEISTSGKTNFKRRVRTAKCVSDDDLLQEFGGRYSEGWRVPPSQALCARVWFVDDGLPRGLECVDQMLEGIGIAQVRSEQFPGMSCDWLALLKDSVAAGARLSYQPYIHRPGSTPAFDELRDAQTERWTASHGEQLSMAAFSALDVPHHPKRIVTHCFLVHVDIQETTPGVFAALTIRSAKMVSLAEVRPLFRFDIDGMKKTLFVQPNLLRTFIIDDSLPIGRDMQVVGMDMSKFGDPRLLYTYRTDWLVVLKEKVEICP
ncbi:hypothetical protein C8R44DRAFT_796139 [Mycena epipterygia]|nr:hypothetical protein C8R44DRAFT_796139 [Mycena epipterygia]